MLVSNIKVHVEFIVKNMRRGQTTTVQKQDSNGSNVC
jgi:hypothetical protein